MRNTGLHCTHGCGSYRSYFCLFGNFIRKKKLNNTPLPHSECFYEQSGEGISSSFCAPISFMQCPTTVCSCLLQAILNIFMDVSIYSLNYLHLVERLQKSSSCCSMSASSFVLECKCILSYDGPLDGSSIGQLVRDVTHKILANILPVWMNRKIPVYVLRFSPYCFLSSFIWILQWLSASLLKLYLSSFAGFPPISTALLFGFDLIMRVNQMKVKNVKHMKLSFSTGKNNTISFQYNPLP